MRTAPERAEALIGELFYEDGSYKELAPSYADGVVISTMRALANVATHHGRSLAPRSMRRLREAVRALGRIADPSGTAPPLHDSAPVPMAPSYAALLPDEMARDGYAWRSSWCDHLPWGGYAVLRQQGRWALLDAGPHGMSHQHFDAMQLLAYAHGKPMLIDPGKPQYNSSALTTHLRSAAAHNVVLPDGRLHQPAQLINVANQPLPMALLGDGPVRVAAAKRRHVTSQLPLLAFAHERVVLDVADLGWIVLDRLIPEDDAAHRWRWLWHVAFEHVTTINHTAHGFDPNGPSLSVCAHGSAAVCFEHAIGETEPRFRGWRADGGESEIIPSPLLQGDSEPITGPCTMLTMLVPDMNAQPLSIAVEMIKLAEDGGRCTINTDHTCVHLQWEQAEEVRRIRCEHKTCGYSELELPAHTL